VPGYIDVLLKQAQVEPPRIDVADLANVSGLDNLSDLTHRSRIEKCMANHQYQALGLSNFYQFLTLRRGGCHRLLDKSMFTCKQAGLGQSIVMLDRRCHDD